MQSNVYLQGLCHWTVHNCQLWSKFAYFYLSEYAEISFGVAGCVVAL